MLRRSNRVKKPSSRAIEAGYAVAEHPRVRELKQPAKRQRPQAAKGKGKAKAEKESKSPEAEEPVSAAPKEENERVVCLLLELVSAALAPDFKPDIEVDLDARRKAFYANHGQTAQV